MTGPVPSRAAADRAGLVVAVLLLLAACAPSRPGPEALGTEAGPICARPTVVDFVVREVRRRAPYDEVLPESIGERPGGDPTQVRCAVTLVRRDYDFLRYWTQTWAGYQEYTVKRLEHGYEVTVGAQR